MAGSTHKRTVTHKNRTIEIAAGKDKKEHLTIDGTDVPFLKHANGLYYTGLLPYSQYKNPEKLAHALIDSHPSFRKAAKAKAKR